MIDEVRAEIDEIASGLGDAQDAATEAARDVMRARAELDALDADISAQSALVSEHDMRITALRGTAEAWRAAARALAAHDVPAAQVAWTLGNAEEATLFDAAPLPTGEGRPLTVPAAKASAMTIPCWIGRDMGCTRLGRRSSS